MSYMIESFMTESMIKIEAERVVYGRMRWIESIMFE